VQINYYYILPVPVGFVLGYSGIPVLEPALVPKEQKKIQIKFLTLLTKV
jgi:hypothetical protein